MSYARVPVSISHHYRILDVRPESVRIPLGVGSEGDTAEAERFTRTARAAALGLWTAALCYAREDKLDGFCPLSALEDYAVGEVIDEMVRAGLLTRAERDGRAGVIVLDATASGRCR